MINLDPELKSVISCQECVRVKKMWNNLSAIYARLVYKNIFGLIWGVKLILVKIILLFHLACLLQIYFIIIILFGHHYYEHNNDFNTKDGNIT